MKAKPTYYNATLFRSKLEAKWAVFFDRLGIDYEYENESYLCSDGSQYTPDFYLPFVTTRGQNGGTFIEIKPMSYIHDSDYEVRIISAIKPNNLVLFKGEPYPNADPVYSFDNSFNNDNVQLSPYVDDHMMFMYCPKCGTMKIEFSESNYFDCPECEYNIPTYQLELIDAMMYSKIYKFKYHEFNEI